MIVLKRFVMTTIWFWPLLLQCASWLCVMVLCVNRTVPQHVFCLLFGSSMGTSVLNLWGMIFQMNIAVYGKPNVN